MPHFIERAQSSVFAVFPDESVMWTRRSCHCRGAWSSGFEAANHQNCARDSDFSFLVTSSSSMDTLSGFDRAATSWGALIGAAILLWVWYPGWWIQEPYCHAQYRTFICRRGSSRSSPSTMAYSPVGGSSYQQSLGSPHFERPRPDGIRPEGRQLTEPTTLFPWVRDCADARLTSRRGLLMARSEGTEQSTSANR